GPAARAAPTDRAGDPRGQFPAARCRGRTARAPCRRPRDPAHSPGPGARPVPAAHRAGGRGTPRDPRPGPYRPPTVTKTSGLRAPRPGAVPPAYRDEDLRTPHAAARGRTAQRAGGRAPARSPPPPEGRGRGRVGPRSRL